MYNESVVLVTRNLCQTQSSIPSRPSKDSTSEEGRRMCQQTTPSFHQVSKKLWKVILANEPNPKGRHYIETFICIAW